MYHVALLWPRFASRFRRPSVRDSNPHTLSSMTPDFAESQATDRAKLLDGTLNLGGKPCSNYNHIVPDSVRRPCRAFTVVSVPDSTVSSDCTIEVYTVSINSTVEVHTVSTTLWITHHELEAIHVGQKRRRTAGKPIPQSVLWSIWPEKIFFLNKTNILIASLYLGSHRSCPCQKW